MRQPFSPSDDVRRRPRRRAPPSRLPSAGLARPPLAAAPPTARFWWPRRVSVHEVNQHRANRAMTRPSDAEEHQFHLRAAFSNRWRPRFALRRPSRTERVHGARDHRRSPMGRNRKAAERRCAPPSSEANFVCLGAARGSRDQARSAIVHVPSLGRSGCIGCDPAAPSEFLHQGAGACVRKMNEPPRGS